MTEQLQELFKKLEHYGIKGWEILVAGEQLLGILGVIACGLLILGSIYGLARILKSKYEDEVKFGLFLVFAVVFGTCTVVIFYNAQSALCPEYTVLKELIP